MIDHGGREVHFGLTNMFKCTIEETPMICHTTLTMFSPFLFLCCFAICQNWTKLLHGHKCIHTSFIAFVLQFLICTLNMLKSFSKYRNYPRIGMELLAGSCPIWDIYGQYPTCYTVTEYPENTENPEYLYGKLRKKNQKTQNTSTENQNSFPCFSGFP